MHINIEQLSEYFSAAVLIAGVLASVLPQQWPLTRWLTKFGACTVRAATKHPAVEAKGEPKS